jgi:hypothetical protein
MWCMRGRGGSSGTGGGTVGRTAVAVAGTGAGAGPGSLTITLGSGSMFRSTGGMEAGAELSESKPPHRAAQPVNKTTQTVRNACMASSGKVR